MSVLAVAARSVSKRPTWPVANGDPIGVGRNGRFPRPAGTAAVGWTMGESGNHVTRPATSYNSVLSDSWAGEARWEITTRSSDRNYAADCGDR